MGSIMGLTKDTSSNRKFLKYMRYERFEHYFRKKKPRHLFLEFFTQKSCT